MKKSLLLVAAVLCAVPSFAAPQGGVLGHAAIDGQSTGGYWTAERLVSAKPLELAPMITADGADVAATAAVDETVASESVGEPGAPPSRRGVPSLRRQL